ncbi:MAG: guanylate kinase [Candidatus Omnitrophica bacterium]|nr:guanylate kinase [Candidatus Omnitrophota bacterium]
MKKNGFVFVISGPSGSGKTTLRDRLVQDPAMRKIFKKSVSMTTRPRRSQERNLRDYQFISSDEFRRLRKEKKLLEWTRYLGYYYATPKASVESNLNQGKHMLLCLDLKGAQRIKKLYPRNSVTIFVKPPTLQTLKLRIMKRCSKIKQEEVARRLALAKEEMKACNTFDHCVLNKSLQQAVVRLKSIVVKQVKS